MFKPVSAVLLAVGLCGATLANANEAESEAAFAQKLQACGACHGEKGDKPLAPDYPVLAGQHADYIAAALRHYRDGRRTHPIMVAQVKALQLTEDDIKGLGEYFAKQPSPLATMHRSGAAGRSPPRAPHKRATAAL